MITLEQEKIVVDAINKMVETLKKNKEIRHEDLIEITILDDFETYKFILLGDAQFAFDICGPSRS